MHVFRFVIRPSRCRFSWPTCSDFQQKCNEGFYENPRADNEKVRAGLMLDKIICAILIQESHCYYSMIVVIRKKKVISRCSYLEEEGHIEV